MRRSLGVFLLIGIAGCSNVWIRPGTTQYQFSLDHEHCAQQSAVSEVPPKTEGEEPRIDPQQFEKCMEALGYERKLESSTVFY